MAASGFRTVFNYNILKKMLLIGFFISAIFITYAGSNIFGVLSIDDNEFVTTDKSYLTVVSKNTDVDRYEELEKTDGVEYVIPGSGNIRLSMPYDNYFQTMNYSATISVTMFIDKLGKSDLLYGRLPENRNEIVVDKMIIDTMVKNDEIVKEAGYGSADKLGDKIPVSNMIL